MNAGDGRANGEDTRTPQMSRMPWYPRDFASSTRGWPLAARGAYRELLDAQWDLGSLPAEPGQLRALAGATPREWNTAWRFIESKMPLGEDGRRRNARLEAHRKRAVEILERRSAAGAAGNAARWGTRR